ncbi:PH domain-containing protein [Subtercola sp. RTI3]|uniref:PH domain-containing protein n=1 Tax=Subtercola sp. RTI3 TaxID=3048639 RepID=UPI002B22FDD7|nr:PH domain-containing protein [Subtercola sp. RTI3]MEA9984438.1 PH domain-containing protein [Subtercola sp. RTI3]
MRETPQNPLDFTAVLHDEQPERVVARYRAHGRRLIWPVLVLVAVAGASGYFLGRFAESWQNDAALGGAILVVFVAVLLPVVSWLARRYTLTTRRVIVTRGLFVRQRHEVSLRRGFDVTVSRRGLQAVFRSGDVTIHSGSEHPLVLSDVPDANLIVSAITTLGEQSNRPSFNS